MNIDKFLTYTALGYLLIPIATLAMMAFGILEPGVLVGDDEGHYYYQIAVIVLLLLIPFALRLMVMERVKTRVAKSMRAYMQYSFVRMAMIETVLLLSAMGYYFYMESSMLWCFGVGLIAMMYIWPTRQRRLHEQGLDHEE